MLAELDKDGAVLLQDFQGPICTPLMAVFEESGFLVRIIELLF